MADYIELDFLDVESAKSGDAITLRYSINGIVNVHVVDGGYLDTGDKVVEHLQKWYGGVNISHVVLTHPDQDHANGLRKVLETCTVKKLWMHRPWIYAEELLPRFSTYKSVEALKRKLKQLYPGPAALEEIAERKGIDILEPFQNERIGAFTVVAPSRSRYFDLVVESERTPQHEASSTSGIVLEALGKAFRIASELVKRAWGDEYFPEDGTSNENEMSVVQFGVINNKRILLTGDVGRNGLKEAADFVEKLGYSLPGLWCFQVPHHGGRHNVNTQILDRWLGPIDPQNNMGNTNWNGVCSSAKADVHHPKKSVIRAIIHRGGHFASTEGRSLYLADGIQRAGYNPVPQADYPQEQEE